MTFHLAQVNIAWMHGPIDEPEMMGLAGRIAEINRLADESKGFVWRLTTTGISHEKLEPFEVDFPGFRRDRLFYNLSVWESVEDLYDYTFRTAHAEMLNDRYLWIDRVEGASVALWWMQAGHLPSIAESAERLRHIRNHGPGPDAFTLRRSFPRPDPGILRA